LGGEEWKRGRRDGTYQRVRERREGKEDNG